MYANVGSIQPVGCPQQVDELAERAVKMEVLLDFDLTKTLDELQQNVEGMTLRIQDIQIEELPMRL